MINTLTKIMILMKELDIIKDKVKQMLFISIYIHYQTK